RFLGAVAALVGNNQLNIPAPAQCSIALQAGDRCAIVELFPKPMLIEPNDGRIDHPRWIESVERRSTRLAYSGRLILKERLIRRHFAGLRRAGLPGEFLQSLPALPTEFVAVPHVD